MTTWTDHLGVEGVARWEALVSFVELWFGGLQAEDGCSFDEITAAEERLGLPLPQALREWYLLVGRREQLIRGQNLLLSPERLFVSDGFLVFEIENQAVVTWGVPMDAVGSEDPPVWMDDVRDAETASLTPHRWVQCNTRLSEFVTQMLLMDLFAIADHGGLGRFPSTETPDLRPVYNLLPLPTWPWPLEPTRFFGDHSTVIVVDGEGGIYASARDYAAHRRMLAYFAGRGIELDVEFC